MKGKKMILASLCLATLLSTAVCNFSINNTSSISHKYSQNIDVNTLHKGNVNIIKSGTRSEDPFTISNTTLANKMMQLLGKTTNFFTPNDLVNHEDYKVIKEKIGGTEELPIYQNTAKKTCLDLSNSNITDITELCQFVWPETLTEIDLTNNGITNEHMTNLYRFMTLAPDCGFFTSLPINANIPENVKIFNLNLNNINLAEIPAGNLNFTRVLYGFQNVKEGYIPKDQISTQYYLRSNYESYFGMEFKFTKNNTECLIETNQIGYIKNYGLGEYIIYSSKIIDEDTTITTEKSFQYFNIYIKDTFSIERKSLFHITKNDIVAEGLSEGYTISFNDPTSTSRIGKQSVNVTFTTNTKTMTFPLEFNIVDTIAPTLKLKGGETIYLAVNGQRYVEYGCLGLDSGDDISDHIIKTGSVDITKPGEYTITYTLKDSAGNEAPSVTRKVVVQEYALKSVEIESLNDEYKTNTDIILTADLPIGVDLTKYKSLKYTWYYNDIEFITTTGDNRTGKSSITLLESEAKDIKIYAILTATLYDDSTESYVSNVMNIEIKKGGPETPSILISVIIAFVIVIIVLLVVIVEKKKKNTHSTNKTSNQKSTTKTKEKKNKKSKEKKSDNSNYDNIQVIRDYKGNDDDPPSTMQF